MDKSLGGGLFSGFKWGTEVEVGDPAVLAKKKGAKKSNKKKIFGDGMGSDRGLGGNNAYRNTESARLGTVDEGQRIRKERLEAYITSTEEGADKTFGKIISGSLILTLIALLRRYRLLRRRWVDRRGHKLRQSLRDLRDERVTVRVKRAGVDLIHTISDTSQLDGQRRLRRRTDDESKGPPHRLQQEE